MAVSHRGETTVLNYSIELPPIYHAFTPLWTTQHTSVEGKSPANNSLCCLILNLSGGVGIGAEGKACVVVARYTADGFDIYAVLESYCGECVSEAVQMLAKNL